MLAEAGGEALLCKPMQGGFTCLHAAAFRGHLPVVQYLAGLPGSRLLNLTASDGTTALDSAGAGGHGAANP